MKLDAKLDAKLDGNIEQVRAHFEQRASYIMTKNFLMVQAPGFIRGINPKLRSIASCAWQPLKSSSPRIYPWGQSKI